jgi:hypothetical protein
MVNLLTLEICGQSQLSENPAYAVCVNGRHHDPPQQHRAAPISAEIVWHQQYCGASFTQANGKPQVFRAVNRHPFPATRSVPDQCHSSATCNAAGGDFCDSVDGCRRLRKVLDWQLGLSTLLNLSLIQRSQNRRGEITPPTSSIDGHPLPQLEVHYDGTYIQADIHRYCFRRHGGATHQLPTIRS